jgi:hypothetical protein
VFLERIGDLRRVAAATIKAADDRALGVGELTVRDRLVAQLGDFSQQIRQRRPVLLDA